MSSGIVSGTNNPLHFRQKTNPFFKKPISAQSVSLSSTAHLHKSTPKSCNLVANLSLSYFFHTQMPISTISSSPSPKSTLANSYSIANADFARNSAFLPKLSAPYHSFSGYVNTRVPKSGKFRAASVIDGEFVRLSADASFYQLLGISESVGFSEIKQAYKQMARKYHPDVSPPDRTEEYTLKFIRVQEAYETLSDPGRRALYDRDLSRGLHLAFSARKRSDEGFEEKTEWRSRWQDQVAELKRRSMNKDSGENLSWAARMRSLRTQSSAE